MILLLRGVIAFIGLWLTVVFWGITIKRPLWPFDLSSASLQAVSASELHWLIFARLVVSVLLYGLGVHVWRRLDDRLIHRNAI